MVHPDIGGPFSIPSPACSGGKATDGGAAASLGPGERSWARIKHGRTEVPSFPLRPSASPTSRCAPGQREAAPGSSPRQGGNMAHPTSLPGPLSLSGAGRTLGT
ncbi:hypothetical protein SKAU_G00265070 [Synaphobranchus kaupii]|uniref:Uncharacterized protein n=1 Tax=Synaphobranchus kaupii TaxID=118154 RepID=A0A9Q1EZ69_SYNKA|nr:hypothetical protein SKAU_G00265070 [Synaphobranchus kaupii]